MGELHCPASVVLAGPGVDVHALAGRLHTRQVAVVYAGPTAAAQAAAGELAALLNLELRPLLAPSGWADAVRALADDHRGETVVVVTADADPRGSEQPGDEPVELEVDEQGIRPLKPVDASPAGEPSAARGSGPR